MNLMTDLDANPNQEKYKLDDEQRKKYLESVILLFTTGISPEKNTPTLLFVSGQTGCGKTEVIKMLKKENRNQVIYTFDEIRAMHPNFAQADIELKGDTHAALFPDTDWACQKLLDYCRENKLNVVKEASMRRIDDIARTARDYRDSGYNIDVRLMAVPSIDSYVGILERYADQLEKHAKARWVSRAAHDGTYDKIPETLTYLISEHLFDSITIYRRGNIADNQPPQVIYPSEIFASPLDAFNYGRTHYTESNKSDFWVKVGGLIKYIASKSPNRIPELQEYILGCYNARNPENEIEL